MSMTAFEILGVLKLDKSDFDKGLDTAKSSAQGISSALSGGVSAIGHGLATAAKVGAAAVRAATTAAVGFGKSSVDAATSFESAFTGVKKTVDASEKEYDTLAKWIMEASTKMASSKEEIAATMEIAGQLGITGVANLEAFTETMIMLGDSTNLNSEEAAGALARFMNITGDSPKNAAQLGSAIVDLGNHFATTESDIVNMSTRLASAGAVAGLSSTDILALSTAMSSVGINAEAGGTAMSQTLAKMTKAVASGGEDLEKFAAISGMSAEDFAATWKNKPIDAITAFIGGLKNVKESDEEMVLVLEDLGLKGIRQTNMLQALALASDMMSDAVNRANTAYAEGNALQHEATMRYQTTESQAKQTAEAFKNLKVVVGEELMPVYGELMSFSKEALSAMQQGFEEGGLEGLMASLGTAISDGLKMLNEKLPDLVNAGVTLLSALGQGLMENLDTITDAATEILGILVKTLADGLPDILAAGSEILSSLLDGIQENLPAITEAIKEFIVGFAKIIAENAEQFVEIAIEIAGAIGEGLKEAAPILMEKAPEILEAIKKGIEENPEALIVLGPFLMDKLGGVFSTALNLLKPVLGKLLSGLGPVLSNGLSSVVSGLGSTLSGAFSSVAGFFTADMSATMAAGGATAVGTAFTAIAGSVAAIFGGAELGKTIGSWLFPDDAELYEHYSGISGTLEMLKDLGIAIKDLFLMWWEEIEKAVGEGWESIKAYFSGAWDVITTGVSDAWESIKAYFTGAWDVITTGVSEAWESIKAYFTGAWDVLTTLVSESWETVKQLFADAWENVKKNVSESWENIKKTFTDAWENVKSKVKDSWENIKKTFSDAWENVKQKVKDSWDAIKQTFSDAWENVKQMVQSSWENIKKTFSDAWENLKQNVTDAWDNIKQTFSDAWDNLTKGISDMWDNIQRTASDFWDDLKGGIEEAIDYIMELPERAWEWGADLIDNFVDGIKGKWDDLKGTLGDMGEIIADWIGFSEPDKGPLSKFHTFAPDMMELFSEGIRDNIGLVEDALSDTAGSIERGFEISAAPSYQVSTAASRTDDRLNSILEMLEQYMPSYATAKDMESMGINIDGRQFGRMVREVV